MNDAAMSHFLTCLIPRWRRWKARWKRRDTQLAYKVLKADGTCYYRGKGKWSLPSDGQLGEWMPRLTEPLVPCAYGYHILRRRDVVNWLGPAIWQVEYRKPVLWNTDKGVCAQARLFFKYETWNEQTQRLFAADCVEHVLPLFEKIYPSDSRPRELIQAVRAYAHSEIGKEALDVAAAAAHAVLTYANANVAHAVVYAATAAAAHVATYAATYAAAYAAHAGTYTHAAAERKWQTERLFAYLDSTGA